MKRSRATEPATSQLTYTKGLHLSRLGFTYSFLHSISRQTASQVAWAKLLLYDQSHGDLDLDPLDDPEGVLVDLGGVSVGSTGRNGRKSSSTSSRCNQTSQNTTCSVRHCGILFARGQGGIQALWEPLQLLAVFQRTEKTRAKVKKYPAAMVECSNNDIAYQPIMRLK